MSILKIKTYPDKILKKNAALINNIDDKLQILIDTMFETMHHASGIGLAAPQIGISKRLITIDISLVEKDHPPIIIINPEIVYSEEEILSEEGCLSVPEFNSTIKRYNRVFVKGIDKEGNPLEIEATGILSRAIQHEIDHLNGTLIIDRLNPSEKKLFKETYLKGKKKV